MDPAYAWGLRLNAIAFLLLLIYFLHVRYRTAQLERAAEMADEARSL